MKYIRLDLYFTDLHDKIELQLHYISYEENKEILDSNTLAKRYFRLSENPGIDFLYPKFSLLKDSSYKIHIQSRKSKELTVEIGGLFSSRSINTGYIGLKLNRINFRIKNGLKIRI